MRAADPLRVACPSCGQPPGRWCVDLSAALPGAFGAHGAAIDAVGHHARLAKAERLAGEAGAGAAP